MSRFVLKPLQADNQAGSPPADRLLRAVAALADDTEERGPRATHCGAKTAQVAPGSFFALLGARLSSRFGDRAGHRDHPAPHAAPRAPRHVEAPQRAVAASDRGRAARAELSEPPPRQEVRAPAETRDPGLTLHLLISVRDRMRLRAEWPRRQRGD